MLTEIQQPSVADLFYQFIKEKRQLLYLHTDCKKLGISLDIVLLASYSRETEILKGRVRSRGVAVDVSKFRCSYERGHFLLFATVKVIHRHGYFSRQ